MSLRWVTHSPIVTSSLVSSTTRDAVEHAAEHVTVPAQVRVAHVGGHEALHAEAHVEDPRDRDARVELGALARHPLTPNRKRPSKHMVNDASRGAPATPMKRM